MIGISSILVLSLLSFSIADELKQNGEECDCFLTNGSSSGYFSYHRFHDFRNVRSNFTSIPKVIESYDDDSNLVPTSNFFSNSTGWNGDWDIQVWNNSDQLAPDNAENGDATVLMRNSANNVYIQPSNDSNPNYSTYLTLRTTRLSDFQTVAEFDSTRGNFMHISARFLARVTGGPGACAGMFTYRDSSNPQKVQEIDIEILTQGPRSQVQYTNQPSSDSKGNAIAGATTNSTIPDEIDWTQWNIYRLDWMPKATTWYVNGEQVSTIAENVPKNPSQLILNMWGNGGSWTGNMSVGDEALFQVQWIEIAFNTSGKYPGKNNKRSIDSEDVVDEYEFDEPVERDGHNAEGHFLRKRGHKGCGIVCGIDDVNNTGVPAILYNNSSPAPKTVVAPDLGVMALLPWMSIIAVGAFSTLFL